MGSGAVVNERNLGRALAAFQRTLVAADSRFDRYMRGDTSAMTPEEVRGMDRFQSIGCVNCHNGPMFSDFSTHVLGVPDNPKLLGPRHWRQPDLRVPDTIPAEPGCHRALHA